MRPIYRVTLGVFLPLFVAQSAKADNIMWTDAREPWFNVQVSMITLDKGQYFAYIDVGPEAQPAGVAKSGKYTGFQAIQIQPRQIEIRNPDAAAAAQALTQASAQLQALQNASDAAPTPSTIIIGGPPKGPTIVRSEVTRATPRPATPEVPAEASGMRRLHKGEGFSLAVHSIQAFNALDQYTAPEAGHVFQVVEVELQNDSQSPCDFAPQDFTLKDEKGFESPAYWLFTNPGALGRGTLQPKEKVRGRVCFEVSREARRFSLKYAPGFEDTIRMILEIK